MQRSVLGRVWPLRVLVLPAACVIAFGAAGPPNPTAGSAHRAAAKAAGKTPAPNSAQLKKKANVAGLSDPVQRGELRLQVAFTTRGISDDNKTAITAGLVSLAHTMNDGSGYLNSFKGCVVGDTDKVTCPGDASQADVLVTATLGDRDKTSKTIPITLIAGSLTDHRQTGQLVFSVNAEDQTGKLADADVKSAFNAINLGQWRQLLGTPVLADGTLTTTAYSPFLQLVPETATDRKYVDVLGHYLAARRIKFVVSPFTGIDASGAGTSAATGVCLNSPRYLHYTVSVRQDARPLQARTLLFGQGTGEIVDCGDPSSPIAFKSFKRYEATSLKGSLASIVGILTLSFVSKSNSWANTGAVASSIGSFTDVDPTTSRVEQNIYNEALRNLVDDMCNSLFDYNRAKTASLQAVPTPAPSGVGGDKKNFAHVEAKNSSDTSTVPGSAAVGATAATSTTLAVGGIVVPAQPPLVCN